MALELTYKIDVVTPGGAEQKLDALDRGFESIDASAKKAGQSVDALKTPLNRTIVDANGVTVKLATLGDLLRRLSDRDLDKFGTGLLTVDGAIRKVQADADKAAKSFAKMDPDPGGRTSGAINKLTSSLGRYVSAAAIGLAIKRTADYADSLGDMSSRLGIGVEAMQRLQFTASQMGVKMAPLELALQRINDGVGGGNKGVAKAIQALGLSFDELRKKSPDERLKMIAQRLGQVTDPAMKASLQMDLFGRNAAKIQAVGEAMDTVGKNAPVMSEKTVNALGNAADSFDRLKATGMALLGNALTPMAEWFVKAPQWAQALGLGFLAAIPMVNSLAGAIGSLRLALVSLASTPAGLILMGIAGGVAVASYASSQALAQAQGSLAKPGQPIDPTKITIDDPRLQNLKPPTGSIIVGRGQTGMTLQDILRNRLQSFQDDYNYMLSAAQKSLISTYRGVASTSELAELTGAPELAVKRYVDLLAVTTAAAKAADREAKKAQAVYNRAVADLNRIQSTFTLPNQIGAYLDPKVYFKPPAGTTLLPESGSFGTVGGGIAPGAMFAGAMAQAPTVTGRNVTGPGGITSGGGMFSGFGQTIAQDLPNVVLGAFMGGGSALKSVGGLIGGALTQGIGNVAGKALGGVLGKSLGSALGSVIPGLGTMLGGAIGGLFGNLFGGEARKTRQMRDEFVQSAGGLDELKRKAESAGFSLDKLFSTKKTKDFQAEVQKLNEALQLKAVKDARKDFVDAAGGIDELARRASRAHVKLDDLFNAKTPQAFEDAVKDINKAFAEQERRIKGLQTAADGLALSIQGFAERLTREFDKAFGQGKLKDLLEGRIKIGSLDLKKLPIDRLRAELQRMGVTVVNVFMSTVRETGSVMTALQTIGPQVSELQKLYKSLGIEVTDANLKWLMGLEKIVEKNPDVMSSIQGIELQLRGLKDAGRVTQEQFDALTGSLVEQYNTLVERGVDGQDAILLMQGPLQLIYDLHKRFGLKVDENTQKLIEMGLKSGAISETQPGFQDLIDVLGEGTPEKPGILGVLKQIASWLGIVKTNAEEAGTAIGNMPPPQGPYPGGGGSGSGPDPNKRPDGYPKNWPWPPVGAPGGPPPGTPLPPPQYAKGGLVYAANGGVMPFTPHGTDTVPAMLTPGEFVIPKKVVDQFGVDFFRRLTGSWSPAMRNGVTFAYGGGLSLYPTGGYNWPGGIGLPPIPTPYPAPTPPAPGGGRLPMPTPVPVPVPVPAPAPMPSPYKTGGKRPTGGDPNRLGGERTAPGPGGTTVINIHAIDAKSFKQFLADPKNRDAVGEAVVASTRLGGKVRHQMRSFVKLASQ